jgi:ATP-dependent DNA helicase RecG
VLSLPLTEGETLELKREWSGRLKGLEDLAAFANTRGGLLVIGVEDDGVTVGGFDPNDEDLRTLTNEVVDGLRLTPEIRRVPTPAGPMVLTVQVQPAATLVAYRGRYLTRVGSTNRDMTPDELARRTLAISGQSWDALPAGGTFDLQGQHPALVPDAIAQFLSMAGPRLPHATPSATPRHTLEKLNLLHGEQPTRAAVLLFGRRPQGVASGAGVQIAQFSDGRILQERVIAGPLIGQLGETLDALRVFLGVGYEIGDRAVLEGRDDLTLLERVQRADRWPYPLAALREAVVNALIHRDYTSSDRIQIRVQAQSLSLWSPGSLPAGVSLAALSQPEHPSRPRNRLLADTVHLAGLIERWGTGTTRMLQLMAGAGLTGPTFAEAAGGFQVTFELTPVPAPAPLVLNARQRQALAHLRRHPSLTSAGYSALTGVSERTAVQDLRRLVDADLLVRQGQARNVSYRLARPEIPH